MRRKLKRFALILLGLALVGFLGWHAYIEIRLTRAERAVKELGYPVTLDGWLERWRIPPGEANAADLYLEAFEAMTDEGIDYDLLPIFGPVDIPEKGDLYPAEVLEEMRRFVALNEGALDLLLQAEANARCSFYATLLDVHTESEGPVFFHADARNAARLLSLTAILRSEEGDLAGAAAATRATIVLAGHLHETLTDWLVGHAILSMASGTFESILDRHAFPIDALSSLEGAFGQYEAEDTFGVTLVADEVLDDRLFAWPFLALVEGFDGDLVSSFEKRFMQRGFLFSVRLGGLRRLVRVYFLRDLPVVIPLLNLPVHESIERASEADWSKSSLLSRLLDHSSNLSEYPRYRAMLFARVRVTQTALLVERYRAEKGVLPESLSDLVPAFAASVPANPFTGDEMEYGLTESGYRIVCPEAEFEANAFAREVSFTVERD